MRSVAVEIPDEFISCHIPSENNNLIGDFCEQELERRRPDDKTALAPFQELSLGDIAHELVVNNTPSQTTKFR